MKTFVTVGLVLAALSAPTMAQDAKAARARYAIAVARADLQSATAVSARRSLRRIDRAAMAACGATGGSLREVTKAVQASACWHDAVSDAVRRIDAPLLSQAWHDGH